MTVPTPENTSARDPFIHILGAMSDGLDGYITGMEAAGQRQLVGSDTLPTDAPWGELIALGFAAGEPVPGDPMFRHCSLPDGWAREGSDHAMWSYIVDDRGVRRVSIFYKAAFYDRSAHASIARPGHSLATEAIYGDGKPELPAQWAVLTEGERADFCESVDSYLEKVAEHPGIYGDRAPRVQTLQKLATHR